jgi:hypothetical protein
MALLAGMAFALSAPAHAELGGGVSTIESDGARMGAKTISRQFGTSTLHTLTRPNGGTVHELTNSDGQVFAVVWAGPGKPDLRALLGRYFATFQSSNASVGRALHGLRRPPQVNQPDLQIQTAGHMGWFRGIAFIPSLAPPGFSASDLPQEP